MPGSLDLALAFNLPPERAVEYFQSRGLRVASDWQAAAHAVRSGRFAVAGVMKAQVLDDIQASLQKSLSSGTTYADWLRDLKPKLQAQGWLGRWPHDPATGEIQPGKGLTPRHLETVFRTNLQSAYMAGRLKGMVEASDSHPYWQYIAILDSRTRPAHRALNGRVFRWDDPIWSVIYPPNGYRCRCRVRPLSQADMEREGLALSKGEGMLDTVVVDLGPRGGKVSVTGYRDPGTGELFLPDPGFDHSPADAWRVEVELARRVTEIGSRDIRAQAWQALNNSPERTAAWLDRVDAALATRDAPLRTVGDGGFVLGFVDEKVADFARVMAPGVTPTRVLVMNEAGLAKATSTANVDAGIALTRDQYAVLPGVVAKPDAVYWDAEQGHLVYVRFLVDGTAISMPVAPALEAQAIGKIDAVVNAYRVPAEPLRNSPARYIKMEGA